MSRKQIEQDPILAQVVRRKLGFAFQFGRKGWDLRQCAPRRRRASSLLRPGRPTQAWCQRKRTECYPDPDVTTKGVEELSLEGLP
eukprot:169842-Rhodomonas_salina.2